MDRLTNSSQQNNSNYPSRKKKVNYKEKDLRCHEVAVDSEVKEKKEKKIVP